MLKFIIKCSLTNDDALFDVTIEYPHQYSDEVYNDKEKWEQEQPQIAHLINSSLDIFFNGNFLKKSDASCYIVLSSGKKEKLPDDFLLKDYSFHQLNNSNSLKL